MITYRQSTGSIQDSLGYLGIGYSGHGAGLDNPEAEAIADVGPIPAGCWRMVSFSGDAHYEDKGPAVIVLEPMPDDAGSIAWAHGRAGFLVHGDNSAMNYTASHGCIVTERPVRARMWADSDKGIQVVN